MTARLLELRNVEVGRNRKRLHLAIRGHAGIGRIAGRAEDFDRKLLFQ
jgi:hypothetical protein